MLRSARALHRRLGFRALDPVLYVLWAGAQCLISARSFYGYMMQQTGGEWSAPLDDVFIHFDYARATALGHPFEWTVGNGYSSGNTSLSYPFVLAFGWLLGFVDRDLMIWAAIVACVAVFGTLLAARQLFIEHEGDDWGRAASYLLPPIFLGVGALDWSLWSGMEVAFFLGTWALALAAWLRLERGGRTGERGTGARALGLGLAGALMVVTRPEAAATIAIFGIAAALTHARRGRGRAAIVLVLAGLPSVVCLAAQSIANRALTGEWSANGAIVKLALNNPYMTADDKLADWTGNARYAAMRNLDYHFAHAEGDHASALVDALHVDNPALVHLARSATWAGVIPLALGLLPLVFARTRRIGVILWGQILCWIAIVALNGQVRWQNERYVMPAVAWLLVLAALGVAVSLRAREKPLGAWRARGSLRPNLLLAVASGVLVVQVAGVLVRPAAGPGVRVAWSIAALAGVLFALVLRPRWSRALLVALALLFAWDHQLPKMRDQKWFFGRASRNIRDQHLALGRFLAEVKPQRVLVGDAGAILYESDRPGLDIIGLGGFRDLPFARAGVHGLPATIELIERIPPAERPDVLAIFPTWFGVLPLWFASEEIRRFPVEGNVICGGYEHIVYRADWRVLGTGDDIRVAPDDHEQVRVEVDVGDLVSEKENRYSFTRPRSGWTDMRVLPDPRDPRHDLFDAGRRIGAGHAESFVARGLTPGKAARLIVRTAPEGTTRARVLAGGADVGVFELSRAEAWTEPSIVIPAAHVRDELRIEILNEGPGDFVDYHVWLTQ